MYRKLHKVITTGIYPDEKIIRAAKAVSHGGLGVAAMQMAFGGRKGIEIDLTGIPGYQEMEDWQALFSESLGRVLFEVPPGMATRFEDIMGDYPIARIGTITDGSELKIYGRNGRAVVHSGIEELGDAWKAPMKGYI